MNNSAARREATAMQKRPTHRDVVACVCVWIACVCVFKYCACVCSSGGVVGKGEVTLPRGGQEWETPPCDAAGWWAPLAPA